MQLWKKIKLRNFNYTFRCDCENYDLVHNSDDGDKFVLSEKRSYNLPSHLEQLLCNLGGGCRCKYRAPFQGCSFSINLRYMLNFPTIKICVRK